MIIFKSIVNDRVRVVTGVIDNKRFKRVLKENNNFSNEEQVRVLNMLVSTVKNKKDLYYLNKLTSIKYFDNLKNEIDLINKIFISENIFKDSNYMESEENYILLGNNKVGRSHFIGRCIEEKIGCTDGAVINAISGFEKATLIHSEFQFIKSLDNKFGFDFELVSEEYIDTISEQICGDAYDNYKTNNVKNQIIGNLINKNFDGNKFKLFEILGKERFNQLDTCLKEKLNVNIIDKNNFVKDNKVSIRELLLSELNMLFKEITIYRNNKLINYSDFLNLLKFVNTRKNMSFLSKVKFNIFSNKVERNIKIIDTVGLNRDEGIKINNNIRCVRINDIIENNKNCKYIYMLNSDYTSNATLVPLQYLDSIGEIANTVILVSNLDTKKDYSLENFKEEQINDRLSYNLFNKISSRIMDSHSPLENILDKFDEKVYDNNVIDNKNINLYELSINIKNSFLNNIDIFLNEANWGIVDSIMKNEKDGIDRYEISNTVVFSISHMLTYEIISTMDNRGVLVPLLNGNKENYDNINSKKKAFRENLYNLISICFIKLNTNIFNNIYSIRFKADLREFFYMSVTKERVIKLKKVISLKYDLDGIIQELIHVSIPDKLEQI